MKETYENIDKGERKWDNRYLIIVNKYKGTKGKDWRIKNVIVGEKNRREIWERKLRKRKLGNIEYQPTLILLANNEAIYFGD